MYIYFGCLYQGFHLDVLWPFTKEVMSVFYLVFVITIFIVLVSPSLQPPRWTPGLRFNQSIGTPWPFHWKNEMFLIQKISSYIKKNITQNMKKKKTKEICPRVLENDKFANLEFSLRYYSILTLVGFWVDIHCSFDHRKWCCRKNVQMMLYSIKIKWYMEFELKIYNITYL